MIQILIVDDDKEAAAALKRNIEGQEIRVAGMASNGQEAVNLCGRLCPDVVLMDIRMPVMDGITASIVTPKRAPTVISHSSVKRARDAQATAHYQPNRVSTRPVRKNGRRYNARFHANTPTAPSRYANMAEAIRNRMAALDGLSRARK